MSYSYETTFLLEKKLYKDKIFNLQKITTDEPYLFPVLINKPYDENTLITDIPELNWFIKAHEKLNLHSFNQSQDVIKTIKLNKLNIPTIKEFMIDFTGISKFKFFKPKHYKEFTLDLIYSDESLESIKNNLNIVNTDKKRIKNLKTCKYFLLKFNNFEFLYKVGFYNEDYTDFKNELEYEIPENINSVDEYMKFILNSFMQNYTPLFKSSYENLMVPSDIPHKIGCFLMLNSFNTFYGDDMFSSPFPTLKPLAINRPYDPEYQTILGSIEDYIVKNPDIKNEDILVLEQDYDVLPFMFIKPLELIDYDSAIPMLSKVALEDSVKPNFEYNVSYKRITDLHKRIFTGKQESMDLHRIDLIMNNGLRAGITQDEVDRANLHIKSISIEKYFKNY